MLKVVFNNCSGFKTEALYDKMVAALGDIFGEFQEHNRFELVCDENDETITMQFNTDYEGNPGGPELTLFVPIEDDDSIDEVTPAEARVLDRIYGDDAPDEEDDVARNNVLTMMQLEDEDRENNWD